MTTPTSTTTTSTLTNEPLRRMLRVPVRIIVGVPGGAVVEHSVLWPLQSARQSARMAWLTSLYLAARGAPVQRIRIRVSSARLGSADGTLVLATRFLKPCRGCPVTHGHTGGAPSLGVLVQCTVAFRRYSKVLKMGPVCCDPSPRRTGEGTSVRSGRRRRGGGGGAARGETNNERCARVGSCVH